MEKLKLVEIFVYHHINPPITELMEYHQWICDDPNEEEQKIDLLKTYITYGIVPKASELKNIYNWVYSKVQEPAIMCETDDLSIDTFYRHLGEEFLPDFPSIYSRTRNCIYGTGFDNVTQLINFGSVAMNKQRNSGRKTIDAITAVLRKYYDVEKW